MSHPRQPLTTHAASSGNLFADEALCGATCLTTSTGSMRMTQVESVVDCAVCRDLLGVDA